MTGLRNETDDTLLSQVLVLRVGWFRNSSLRSELGEVDVGLTEILFLGQLAGVLSRLSFRTRGQSQLQFKRTRVKPEIVCTYVVS